MSAQPIDDDTFVTLGIDARDHDRYAEVTLDSGEVLIYDQENEDAWFQSASAVGLAEMA